MTKAKMLEAELFNVWGIEFMGSFVNSYGYKYIIIIVEYVSKWVEVHSLAYNRGKKVVTFLKKTTFLWFGMCGMIISVEGYHFFNKVFRAVLTKYVVKQHKMSMQYNPQTTR